MTTPNIGEPTRFEMQDHIDRLEGQHAADQDRIDELEGRHTVDRAVITELEAEGDVARDKIANLEVALRTSRRIKATMGSSWHAIRSATSRHSRHCERLTSIDTSSFATLPKMSSIPRIHYDKTGQFS